ncbi:MAG: flagellar protein FliT [Burkholderiales bacterium]|nr:flagellar protein FliT [Burkholderiales bacterium]
MNSVEVLDIYEKVATLTAEMRLAAQSHDWELLEKLESDCSAQVGTLKRHESSLEAEINLPVELKQRKINIIKQILADDRAIREITEPWMTELSKLMSSASTSRKLTHSYGANQIG